MPLARQLVVFYDASCALCRASRRALERWDSDGALEFVDGCAAGARTPPGISAEQLDREIWVRLPDGSLVAGYDAVVAVLAVLPRWRLASRVAGMPPVRWAGVRLYPLVARLRRHLHGARATTAAPHPDERGR